LPNYTGFYYGAIKPRAAIRGTTGPEEKARRGRQITQLKLIRTHLKMDLLFATSLWLTLRAGLRLFKNLFHTILSAHVYVAI